MQNILDTGDVFCVAVTIISDFIQRACLVDFHTLRAATQIQPNGSSAGFEVVRVSSVETINRKKTAAHVCHSKRIILIGSEYAQTVAANHVIDINQRRRALCAFFNTVGFPCCVDINVDAGGKITIVVKDTRAACKPEVGKIDCIVAFTGIDLVEAKIITTRSDRVVAQSAKDYVAAVSRSQVVVASATLNVVVATTPVDHVVATVADQCVQTGTAAAYVLHVIQNVIECKSFPEPSCRVVGKIDKNAIHTGSVIAYKVTITCAPGVQSVVARTQDVCFGICRTGNRVVTIRRLNTGNAAGACDVFSIAEPVVADFAVGPRQIQLDTAGTTQIQADAAVVRLNVVAIDTIAAVQNDKAAVGDRHVKTVVEICTTYIQAVRTNRVVDLHQGRRAVGTAILDDAVRLACGVDIDLNTARQPIIMDDVIETVRAEGFAELNRVVTDTGVN